MVTFRQNLHFFDVKKRKVMACFGNGITWFILILKKLIVEIFT